MHKYVKRFTCMHEPDRLLSGFKDLTLLCDKSRSCTRDSCIAALTAEVYSCKLPNSTKRYFVTVSIPLKDTNLLNCRQED